MLLDEIGNYLQTQGVGTLGSTLFLSVMPDTPDDVVSVYDYGGLPPVMTLGAGAAKWEEPRIQVVARATTYSAARTKIGAVFTALHSLLNTSLSGTLYLSIEAVQSPFTLDRDTNGRVRCACNFHIRKALS